MRKAIKNIVVISSHFDDAEIGCAGTILQHMLKGHHVKFYVINSDEHLTGDPSVRFAEQRASKGCFLKYSKYKNLEIQPLREEQIDKDIIGMIDEELPDILFVPWEHDTHQDHRRSSIIGQAVGRKRPIQTFFYSSGSTYDFNPTIFNPIDFDKKREILKCFSSQIKCGAINIDIIEKREAYWASLISMTEKHAEGFIARKMRYPYD